MTSTSPSPLPSPNSTAHQPATTTSAKPDLEFNTHALLPRILTDLVAASVAGALVAPVITAIDRAIIENASGRRGLKESLRASVGEMVGVPGRFFGGRAFGLVFLLYTGTYLTANLVDTASSTFSPSTTPSISSTTAGPAKFAATSSANLALCLYKDNRFTQMFGAASPSSTPTSSRTAAGMTKAATAVARPRVPLPTFTLFTIRDCLTIFASFNLPPLLAPHISPHLSSTFQSYMSASSVAQFVTPAAVQIVSTPLHLLGLDLFNRREARPAERASRVLRDWGVSCVARMGRIVPAFGVGGVVNAKVRGEGMGLVERMG
ncbi:uncharacterized protein EI97DRAFT_419956 [Westerdykella ornata]|uniref:Sequence orphan n=1 Tax=Westerdykella ornata TaxID=318751 RepID=A0A6A6JL42_WESOR|nr:uncharacterized protein EI97DRAFT_419956 [Westerdykella ornata]KAF2275619.1 hypothetical protein EI97DRAFT_419956 [Westerdykella ornata]